MSPTAPILLRPSEAAALVGLKRAAFYALMAQGVIPTCTHPGMRDQLIRYSDLEAYVASLPIANAAPTATPLAFAQRRNKCR